MVPAATLTYDELARALATVHAINLQLQQQITRKDEALAACKAAYTAIKEEYAGYRRHVQGMMANPKMSPAAKLAAIGLPRLYNSAPGRKDKPAIKPGIVRPSTGEEPEPVPLFLGQIAKEIGMSDDAAGKALQELADAGAVVKEKHHQPDGRTTLSVAPKLVLLTNPRVIAPPEGRERNHGGKRVKCPSCHSDNIVEERTLICADCGTIVKKYDPRPVNPPEETCAEAAEEQSIPATHDNPRVPDGRMAGSSGEMAETPERPDITGVPTSASSVLPGSMGERPTSLRQVRYFETRPRPEDCPHPPNMLHKLKGVWVCAECGVNGDGVIHAERGCE